MRGGFCMRKTLMNVFLTTIISLSLIVLTPEISKLSSFMKQNLFETTMILGLILTLVLLGVIIIRIIQQQPSR